jgi:hypothetical protein
MCVLQFDMAERQRRMAHSWKLAQRLVQAARRDIGLPRPIQAPTLPFNVADCQQTPRLVSGLTSAPVKLKGALITIDGLLKLTRSTFDIGDHRATVSRPFEVFCQEKRALGLRKGFSRVSKSVGAVGLKARLKKCLCYLLYLAVISIHVWQHIVFS